MIQHHEGAAETAPVEITDGKNPDVIALAEQIVETQQAEIDRIQQLLVS